MRLLPVGPDHGGSGTAEADSQAERRRHRRGHYQHLPLRHLSAYPRGNSYRRIRRRQGIRRRAMSNRLVLRRRAFLGTIAAVSGGMALGWRIPAPAQGQAQGQAVGIWVVISPDDTTT